VSGADDRGEAGAVTDPAAVAAAFICTVVDSADVDDGVADALRWAVDVWASGVDAAPLWLVHDLGHALLRGRRTRFRASHAVEALPPFDAAARLRTARLAFEDRVAAAWTADPSFLAASVILAGLPTRTRGRAIAHAIALALEAVFTADRDSWPAGNVARLRAVLERWSGSDDALDPAALARRTDGRALAAVITALERMCTLLAGRRLFCDEDLWELAHLHELPSEAARLALRTVHATAARIPAVAPAVRARLRRRAFDVAVDEATVDVFPAGGFDAMSTKGTLENLVRSEVAYVGEGRPVDVGGQPSGPDLFDVHFVEGELLYYTRDDSPLLEQRRALAIVVEDVDQLRHKVAALPAQTVVLVQAVCLRAHHDLIDIVGTAAVHTTIALAGKDPLVVDEERALLAMSLRADVAHRRVAFSGGDVPPGLRPIFISLRRAPTTMRGPPRGRPASLWVQIGGERWRTDDGEGSEDIDIETPQGLRDVVDRILLASSR
jgi:hypothetical protein